MKIDNGIHQNVILPCRIAIFLSKETMGRMNSREDYRPQIGRRNSFRHSPGAIFAQHAGCVSIASAFIEYSVPDAAHPPDTLAGAPKIGSSVLLMSALTG